MPRGGSRKGERRGGAKRGVMRTPKARSTPAVKAAKIIGNGRGRGVKDIATVERDLEIQRMITGDKGRLPKEMLLDISRYFFETGAEYQRLMLAAMQIDPPTDETRRAEHDFEMRARDYFIMASDAAYKAAPYYHPRLSAIAINPRDGGPLDALRELLDEIDGEVRGRVIEHQPHETRQ